MKKIARHLLIANIILSFFTDLNAQNQPASRNCASSELIQQVFQNDPSARSRFENTQRLLENQLRNMIARPQARTQAIINIPVVVHIAIANPAQVTDAVVQRQIDTLNYYFGSQAAGDSLRVYTPFRSAYGRTEIRFCLAQRTPANTATNGITRTTTGVTFSFPGAHPSSVVPPWDVTKYLNIWVVEFTDGTLGYAPLPGTYPIGSPTIGFVNNYKAFGSGESYHFTRFNLGRTAVHEIGHFFGLSHPWGTGTSNTTCTATDNCADTPPTDGPTTGCPGSPKLNICSPVDPGVMFQNHMDYADDACMFLFTQNQATIMTASLTLPDRSTLVSSTGCQPIPTTNNDIQVSSILDPVNNSSTACTLLPLKIRLRNNGINSITSAVINVRINSSAAASQNFSGNLAPNGSVDIQMTDLNMATNGNYIIKVHSTLPNGVADLNPSNDTSTITIARINPVTTPISENFESTLFPSAFWRIANPDNNNTWTRRINAGYQSNQSAFINNYIFNTPNQTDEILTPTFSTTGTGGVPADSVIISWYLAAHYQTAPYDTFTVSTSSDCGITFPNVLFNNGGTAIGSNDATNFSVPTEADWKNHRVAIGGTALSSGIQMVGFRNKNQYGNNMFVDNINISLLFKRDITVTGIMNPDAECSGIFTPIVTVKNIGIETVTAFSVSYRINGGAIQTANFTGLNLARNATMNVSLPANSGALIAGQHTITAFTSSPATAGGTGDNYLLNDTLSRSFALLGTIASLLSENFLSSGIPDNWGVFNPDADLTWSRDGSGNGNAGSAWMNNFRNMGRGQADRLHSPNITYTGVDSITLSFDIAAEIKNTSGVTDTVEVLITTNCGNSFTSVYKKWGAELQTTGNAGTPLTTEFFPASNNQWRKENIDLTSFIPNGPIQFVFKNTNGFGNNIFIDNVNLKTRILPASLKVDGIQILPSPFQSIFQIWHLQKPTELRYINIYNTAGQLVWSKSFKGEAAKLIDVNMSRNAAGLYFVHLGYADKLKNQSISVMKTN